MPVSYLESEFFKLTRLLCRVLSDIKSRWVSSIDGPAAKPLVKVDSRRAAIVPFKGETARVRAVALVQYAHIGACQHGLHCLQAETVIAPVVLQVVVQPALTAIKPCRDDLKPGLCGAVRHSPQDLEKKPNR